MNYSKMLVLIGIALCLAIARQAAAASPKNVNPNHDDPLLSLAVHGDGISSNLQQEAESRFRLAVATISAAVAKRERGLLNKIEPQALGKAHVAVLQMQRLAEQLGYLGEPAGAEFQRRNAVSQPVRNIAESYGGTPEGQVFLAKVRLQITNSAQARTATIRRAEELAKREKWEEAEATLYDMLDKLESVSIFLTNDENKAIYEPFSTIRGLVTPKMGAIRSKAAARIFEQRIEAQTPDLDGLLSDITAAADALRSTGVVAVDGVELNGPEAFAHFVQRWEKLHAAMQRLHGIDLASHSDHVGMSYVMPRTSTGETTSHPSVKRYAQTFTGEVGTALAALMSADTSHATPEQIATLYPEYVRAAALPAARSANGALVSTWTKALQELAAKSPALQAQATEYAAATDELLRWRSRLAAAQARAQETKFPVLSAKVQAATTSKKDYYALFNELQPEYAIPRILSATPTFLPLASQQLLKEQVRLTGGRGLTGGKSSVSLLTDRIYATYKSLPAEVLPALQALESDLLVSEGLPPLSLNAAMALETAKAGDFETVGGEISGLHIEGFVTRLAALPDAAVPLIPLGSVPLLTGPSMYGGLLSQAVVRCDVKPSWFHHRAFFVPVP